MSKTVLIVVLVIVGLICCCVCSLTAYSMFIAQQLASQMPTDSSSSATYQTVAECAFETNTVCVADSTGIYSTGTTLVGADLKLQGVVTKVDASMLPVDGPLEITIKTDFGKSVILNSPSGFDLCELSDESRETAFGLEVHDTVEFLGTVNEDGAMNLCDAAHYITKIN